jgi:hypothetical protein
VAVEVDGAVVGYLAADMAAEWQPIIAAKASEGLIVAGTASILGGTQDEPTMRVVGVATWAGPAEQPGR